MVRGITDIKRFCQQRSWASPQTGLRNGASIVMGTSFGSSVFLFQMLSRIIRFSRVVLVSVTGGLLSLFGAVALGKLSTRSDIPEVYTLVCAWPTVNPWGSKDLANHKIGRGIGRFGTGTMDSPISLDRPSSPADVIQHVVQLFPIRMK